MKGVSLNGICRHCRTPFPVTRTSGRHYCCRECKAAACKRVCPQCTREFDAPHPASKKVYCSPECLLASQTGEHLKSSWDAHRERARVVVVCNWRACPRPQDLIEVPRWKASKPFYCRHDECKEAFRQACNGGSRLPEGNEAFCQVCGDPVGYRSRGELETGGIYCVRCVGRPGRQRPRRGKGETRPCGLVGCTNEIWVTAFKLKHSKTNIFVCCSAHFNAVKRTAPRVRCVTCGYEKVFHVPHVPPDVDALATHWQCPACRPRTTAVCSFECAQCHDTFSRRIRLARPAAERQFCTLTCRQEYARVHAPYCRRCDHVIRRRGHGQKPYCSRACAAAAARGQPHPHTRPSIAEGKILEQWRAGVRGIKKLAAMSGTAPNTVRKLQRAGHLSDA